MKIETAGTMVKPVISDFEATYIALRRKENRIYSNEQVRGLPGIEPSHPHCNEWLARKQSSRKLVGYLRKKNMPLKILEVGCGNGWLSSRLAEIPNSRVIGLDVNRVEVQQAEETFDMENLRFVHDEINNDRLPRKIFDIIVFAASIQYFKNLDEAVSIATSFLNTRGEIHILDTPFYDGGEVRNAAIRSQQYYASMGFPQMAGYYFHHQWKELKNYHYKLLYHPGWLINRLWKPVNNFPWIRIKS